MNEKEYMILRKLMDTYNRSKHSELNGVSSRGVILDLEKAFARDTYDPFDYDSVNEMNDAILLLADKNFITYVRDKYNENYIKKVYLNLDKVDEISIITGLKDNKMEMKNISDIIRVNIENEKCEWLYLFLNDVLDAILNKNQLLIMPNNTTMIIDIIKVLKFIAKEKGFYIRLLSTQLFSNSKYIEKNILKYIIQIIKNYHPDICDRLDKDELSDNELLRSVGLLTYEEVFELTGDCKAIYENSILDFSCYVDGMYIGSNMASKLSELQLDRINIITLIENKMNYVQYCKEEKESDELVIFSGGFYSIQRKRFYQTLKKCMVKKQRIRLWADIDLGGFKMFKKLKEVFHQLEPMRMDKDMFIHHLSFARSMSDAYFQKIEIMKEQEGYELFYDVIEEILKHKKVLEQESFYIENNNRKNEIILI